MIDITGVDLVRFVKEVYALSRPQGLGMLHYREGALSDEDAHKIVERERPDSGIAVSLDYVNGRACKMTVWREGDRLIINDRWFDHSDSQLAELLRRVGKGGAA